MIDTNRIIMDMQDMNVSEINSLLGKLNQEFQIIQKNTFADRLRKHFEENLDVKYVNVSCSSNCNNDDMYFDVAHYIEDDQLNNIDDLLDDISKEIFDMCEGMSEESMEVRFHRDFKSFDDHVVDEGYEDENEQEG